MLNSCDSLNPWFHGSQSKTRGARARSNGRHAASWGWFRASCLGWRALPSARRTSRRRAAPWPACPGRPAHAPPRLQRQAAHRSAPTTQRKEHRRAARTLKARAGNRPAARYRSVRGESRRGGAALGRHARRVRSARGVFCSHGRSARSAEHGRALARTAAQTLADIAQLWRPRSGPARRGGLSQNSPSALEMSALRASLQIRSAGASLMT